MAEAAAMAGPQGASEGVATLRTLQCVRERCNAILALAKADKLKHFKLNEAKIDAVADFVKGLMDKDYPSYDAVPFHSRLRHFEAGGIDRVTPLTNSWACGPMEEARRLIDLVVVSVLLDAGAGNKWRYTEKGTNFKAGRSEGLGVASFHMFYSGAFSSDVTNPHRADAVGLQRLPDDAVRKAFQATNEAANPLVGCDGRTQVLKRLGSALLQHPQYFEREGLFRPGNMVDYLFAQAGEDGSVSLTSLWEVVMYGFEAMWPADGGRVSLDGRSMGDVWKHSALPEDGTNWGQLIPFHKLSQWLTFSLMEPLMRAGMKLKNTTLMTGLPEYRNGGLLVDMGVLEPQYPEVVSKPHTPDEEVIVEWRALTVALLDEIYAALRAKIGQSEEEFPLVKMLECGTWKAGRVVAQQRDPATSAPPIQIISDGTVF
ncbi:hypothetical protein JKP88DRAFT_261810 [Tribonema minus]|uniref:Uracil catabolism protein 4 n=1 Tax=Tribonema minus TaxID=303371 RepID=A0A835ZFF8_9STRA|nr:hypothetical protein JKP88DRAFT_261810 [Tribonema minus]